MSKNTTTNNKEQQKNGSENKVWKKHTLWQYWVNLPWGRVSGHEGSAVSRHTRKALRGKMSHFYIVIFSYHVTRTAISIPNRDKNNDKADKS
jgi:hypothetical protein